MRGRQLVCSLLNGLQTRDVLIFWCRVLAVRSGEPVPAETYPGVVLERGACPTVLTRRLSTLHSAVFTERADVPFRTYALEGSATIVAGAIVQTGVSHAVIFHYNVTIVPHVPTRALTHVVTEVGRDAGGTVQAGFR